MCPCVRRIAQFLPMTHNLRIIVVPRRSPALRMVHVASLTGKLTPPPLTHARTGDKKGLKNTVPPKFLITFRYE